MGFCLDQTSDLQKLAAAFGLVYYKENNQITHSMDTILLSPDGTVKQAWPGNDWKFPEVIDAIKSAATS